MRKNRLSSKKINLQKLFSQPITWIVIAAFLLRIYKYTFQSIWLDETISIFLANKPVSFILTFPDPTPPLFYILLHFWSYMGMSEWVLKLLPVLLGTVTVYAVYLLTKRIHNKESGLFAATLAAVSPTLIYYSQEIRAYALFFLLNCLVIYFYTFFDDSRRYRIYYALAFIAVLYTHFYSIFVLAAIQIHRLVKEKRKFFTTKRWIKTHAAIFIFSIPWIIWVVNMVIRDEASWIRVPKLADLLAVIPQSIQGSTQFIPGTVLFVVALIVLLWSLYSKESRFEYYWIAIPLLVPFLASLIMKPFFYPRYVLLISVPILMLIATRLSHIKQKALKFSILGLLVVLSFSVAMLQAHSITKDPWEQVKAEPPVAFIAFYEAFPYIYLHAPECFKEYSIGEVYVCAAQNEIYAIQEAYPLEDRTNVTFVLSKYWLTEEDTKLYQEYIPADAKKTAYEMNTDVWIFKNNGMPQPIYVVYANT